MAGNIGKAAAFNRTIPRAKGKILAFIDSDDWQFPGRSLSMIDAHSSSISQAWGSNYLSGSRTLSTCFQSSYPTSDHDIRLNFPFFPYLLFSSLSINASTYSKNDLYFSEDLRAGIDYDFYGRLLSKISVGNLIKTNVYYTKSPDGITSSPETRKQQLKVHSNVLSTLLKNSTTVDHSFEFLADSIVSSITRGEYRRDRNATFEDLRQSIHILRESWISNNPACSFFSKLPTNSLKSLLSKFEQLLK